MAIKRNAQDHQVAQSVQRLRLQRGFTLRDLAKRSGVSSSTISDIERAAKSPTLSTLSAVAMALEVPLSALIDSPAPASQRLRVVRSAERTLTVDAPSGGRRESFGPAVAGSRVDFLSLAIPPHAIAGPFPPHGKGTIEHVHVHSGSVRFVLGTDTATLAAGDSCSCVADLPHTFDNQDGDAEALLYVVIELP